MTERALNIHDGPRALSIIERDRKPVRNQQIGSPCSPCSRAALNIDELDAKPASEPPGGAVAARRAAAPHPHRDVVVPCPFTFTALGLLSTFRTTRRFSARPDAVRLLAIGSATP